VGGVDDVEVAAGDLVADRFEVLEAGGDGVEQGGVGLFRGAQQDEVADRLQGAVVADFGEVGGVLGAVQRRRVGQGDRRWHHHRCDEPQPGRHHRANPGGVGRNSPGSSGSSWGGGTGAPMPVSGWRAINAAAASLPTRIPWTLPTPLGMPASAA
jgi:hypothetical protein